FAVRPEKLRVHPAGSAVDEPHARGTIAEVVYAGPVTRYVVDLDAGSATAPRVVVLHQNGTEPTGSAPHRGDQVLVTWRPEHLIAIPDPGL
ncbi:MAG TPA: TOBE domain-containing protein, partial [Dermatophilaceae bacterium]|nr:TOBE domain-containing protein [Dermatophilaceae bacterium]